jgi:enamine deaminase RidA (YjgF/YER057c/UK114 family)
MTIRRIDTGPRMSQAVMHGDIIYLAGQVAAAPAGDVAGQTTAVLNQIDDILHRCGSSKERILSATIYLADMTTFSDMNKAWDAWVTAGAGPARATVGTKLAAPQYLVEIAVIAAMHPSKTQNE